MIINNCLARIAWKGLGDKNNIILRMYTASASNCYLLIDKWWTWMQKKLWRENSDKLCIVYKVIGGLIIYFEAPIYQQEDVTNLNPSEASRAKNFLPLPPRPSSFFQELCAFSNIAQQPYTPPTQLHSSKENFYVFFYIYPEVSITSRNQFLPHVTAQVNQLSYEINLSPKVIRVMLAFPFQCSVCKLITTWYWSAQMHIGSHCTYVL